jgi:hypothetical protein
VVKWLGLILVAVVIGAVGYLNLKPKANLPGNQPLPTKPIISSPEPVNYTAEFAIYTNGTFRVFTSSMYHNLSTDVFITADNPNLIQVKKADTTWQEFFNTLPFKLDKNCLVTGTGQTFCTNEEGELSFTLNDANDPEALDKVIQPGDELVVSFDRL